jgi:hypothetical protein
MALSNTQVVTDDYADILFDTTNNGSNIATYASLMASNPSVYTAASVAAMIASPATSPEVNIVNYVYSLYSSVLGVTLSNATMFGLKYWVQAVEGLSSMTANGAANVLAGTLTSQAISFLDQSFINAAPATSPIAIAAATPSQVSASALVSLLYQQAFGVTAPAASGVTYWVNQYNAWAASPSFGSAQALVLLVNSFANGAAVTNSPAIGSLLAAAALTDTGSGPTYGSLPVPSTPGQTYTLTTGTDKITITGNNSVVNGTGSAGSSGSGATYTSGDVINGGAFLGNTLNVVDLATGAGSSWTPTSVTTTVSGIQTVNFSSAEAVTADVTKGFTGLTALNIVSGSDGSTVDVVAAGAGTAVKVTDTTSLKAVGANLTVTGGSSVAIAEANGGFINAGKTITVAGGTGTTSVSVVQTENAAGNDQAVAITDVNEVAGAKGVITSVTLDGLDNTANYAINDNALASLTINNAVSGAVVVITEGAYSAPATSLALALTSDASFTLNDAGSKYTALAITTGGNGANLTAGAGFTAVASETIAGSAVLTQTAAAMTSLKSITLTGSAGLIDSDLGSASALASVASSSSGLIVVSLNDTQTSFAGGSGQDIVTVTAAATKAITGGSAGTNEIVLNNAAAVWSSLANISNFTTLGVAGHSSGTYDFNVLTGFSAIDVQAGTGTVSFVNVTEASPLAIDGSATAITYKTVDHTGTIDSLGLTIGGTSANATADVIGSLTLTDSAGTGIDTLTVTGYDTTAGAGHTIATLVDNALAHLTLAGTASETIGSVAFVDQAATVTITNNSTSSATSTITMTDSLLSLLNLSGSGPTTVVLTDGYAGTFNLTDNASAAATVTTALANVTTLDLTNSGSGLLTVATPSGVGLAAVNFYGSGAQSASFNVTSAGVLVLTDSDSGAVSANLTSTLSNLSITDSAGLFTLAAGSTSTATTIGLSNSGTGSITVAGLTDAQATTVTLSGAVSLTLTDALANTVSIVGGTDNANVSVTLNHAAAGATNITLGNGNDSVVIADSTSLTNATTVTIGSGNNSVSLLPGHTGGDETVAFSGANGGSTTALTTIINAVAGDNILWAAAAQNATVTHEGLVSSIVAGLSGLSATNGYTDFIVGSRTFIYENTGTAATSELVAVVGTHPLSAATTTAGAVLS